MKREWKMSMPSGKEGHRSKLAVSLLCSIYLKAQADVVEKAVMC